MNAKCDIILLWFWSSPLCSLQLNTGFGVHERYTEQLNHKKMAGISEIKWPFQARKDTKNTGDNTLKIEFE